MGFGDKVSHCSAGEDDSALSSIWDVDSPWHKAAQLLTVIKSDLKGIWKIKRNNTYKDSRVG